MATRSRDADIRAALRARFLRRYGDRQDVVVVEELPVCRGTVRADMAVISDRIEGFEIKSAADVLDRLPRQVEYYGAAMDRMTLITDLRHLEEALAIVPDWWTVFSADMGARGGICLRRFRRGRANPGRTAAGVAELLERDELIGVLCRHGLDRGWRGKYVYELADRIVSMLTLDQVTAAACRQLKVRAYLEQQYEKTAFGRAAFGGGLAALAAESASAAEAAAARMSA